MIAAEGNEAADDKLEKDLKDLISVFSSGSEEGIRRQLTETLKPCMIEHVKVEM